MRFVVAGSLALSGLVANALIFNAPLLIAARLARERLHPLAPRLALAVGFALATAYRLWDMEWFDVWRHGVPSVRYMLVAYLLISLP
jgi:preprotein translocase subunit Sec61beta